MKHYWLFKAEPEVYGIEHLLAAPAQTTRWDGIRNYQARNFLRDQVQIGDEVFFYHSHRKQPAIVGSVRVVKSAYPDPSQFDPESPYFDPKSTPENSRWVAVDIRLQQQFTQPLSLNEIKQHPALNDMILLRQPRLSIQPVTAEEWKIIHQLLKNV